MEYVFFLICYILLQWRFQLSLTTKKERISWTGSTYHKYDNNEVKSKWHTCKKYKQSNDWKSRKINKADIIKDNEKINKIKTSEAVQYRNCHENKNNGILKEHNHYNNNIGWKRESKNKDNNDTFVS